MTDRDVLDRLSRILGDLLANDSLQLTMQTERKELPDWDSFAYINFIVAAEQEFDVTFGVAEVEAFETVGAIVRRIEEITLKRSCA
jgi:acyl carrier protein